MKRVITITGPSASGKSTMERRLSQMGIFERVISTTTRPMRDGETSGLDYYFIDEYEFQWLIDANEFVDHKSFNDSWYGATHGAFNEIFEDNKVAVIVVEPTGAKRIKEYGETHGWDVMSVFIGGDLETLVKRFVSRMTPDYFRKNAQDITKRLELMMTDERDWKDFMKWDLELDYFDETNDYAVLELIADRYRDLAA